MPDRLSEGKTRLSVVMERGLVARLDAAAGERGVSRSSLISEACLAFLESEPAVPDDGDETVPMEVYRDMVVQLTSLTAQLGRKDAQISDLGSALKAEQALHASALGLSAPEPADTHDDAGGERHKPGRWARLRAAWKG